MGTKGGPVVSLRGIGRTYPAAVPVEALSNVDLTIRPGEYVAVVGTSGSGKSTLLNVVGLLDPPTAGSYKFEGDDVSELDDAAQAAVRGQRIGFVFQAFHLMAHRSAVDNVMVSQLYNRSDRHTRRARAEQALERVGLGHRMAFQPPSLSGGEKQRVAIARAVAAQPTLLLCDEPTGNLDTDTTHRILDLLSDLNDDGLTIAVVTHDPQVAKAAERTVRLVDGCVAADTGP